MKTLDEVIKALSIPAVNGYHYIDSNDAIDVLRYLEKYRNCGACAYADSYLRCTKEDRNDPLSWDELKTMEGKPVWIEYSGYAPNWEIVENIGAVRGSTGDFTGNFIETNKSVLYKDIQGKLWQAYRKKRK